MAKVRDVIEGLLTLSVYLDVDSHDICAEHDVIYVGHSILAMSEEAKEKLQKCGWYYDTEAQSWARFV